MLYSEYEVLYEDGASFGFDSEISVQSYEDLCSANDMVALPLAKTSPMYERDAVISIVPAGSIMSIGYLLTCKGQDFGYGQASAELVSAYLSDAEPSDVIDSLGVAKRNYIFKRDYVVVSIPNYADYVSLYREGSGLWGAFTHCEDQPNPPTPHVNACTSITAVQNTKVVTDAEKDALWRSVAHSSPLERYLKIYHLLELHFDLQLVEQIRSLGGDLKGIGKLLNSYSGDKEFDRLHKVVKSCCPDEDFFAQALALAFADPNHHDQWHEILFEYSKESNPYKERGQAFLKAIQAGFSKTEWTNNGLAWNYEHLSKFASYLVYRIRSSIAHFKIGEYLLSSDDEEFVAKSAEPLIREIVLAAYKQ